MKRAWSVLVLVAATACRSLFAQSLPGSVPSSQLAARPYHGFADAVPLANARVHAVVVPAIGRIMDFGLVDETSPFRADRILLARGVSGTGGDWRNFGGCWLWPAAQNRWKEFCGRDWPPPPGVDDAAWRLVSWRQADGSLFCRLSADLGAPFHARVTRECTLAPKSLRLVMSQRIERTAESAMPLSLWNIAQIDAVDEVVLPVEPGSEPVSLGFAPLDPAHVRRDSNTVAIAVRAGTEHKIGSRSPRSWIAARKGRQVVLLSARPGDAADPYPDGGCRLEMYTNRGLGYTEIETMGPERVLRPGESTTNTVVLQIHAAAAPVEGAALAAWCRQLAGDEPFPAAP